MSRAPFLLEGVGGLPGIKQAQASQTKYPATFSGGITTNGIVNTASSLGTKKTVTNITTSTYAPTAAQSGSIFTLNLAAGIVITLPAPVVGLEYRFVVSTANTGTLSILTDAGTTYLQGAIVSATTTASIFNSVAGTHNIDISMNGSTTGGLIGTDLSLVCIAAALWQVSGTNFTSSTTATPFATS